jgi:hypothetical protein
MDIDLNRLRYLDEIMPANVTTIYCDPHAVEHYAVNPTFSLKGVKGGL